MNDRGGWFGPSAPSLARRLRRWVALVAFFILMMQAAGARSESGDDPPPFYADKTRLLMYLDPGGKEHPVKDADDWAIRRRHILVGMQQAMGPLPDATQVVEPHLEVLEETDTPHYTLEKITFAVEANDRVSGYLLRPKPRDVRRPAMLCLHQTVAIGAKEPAGLGKSPNLRYAAELADRGYVTLAVDYPNFGDYKFDPYRHGYASATMKGIWNHMRAVDVLQSLSDVDPARIGVIGHSLGGHNSLFVAAFDERIKCAVTCCGFCSFRAYFNGDLTGWSHKGYMPRIKERYHLDPAQMPFDFTEVLAAIAPRAVFIVAPERDANFSVAGVRECVSAASPVFDLLGDPNHLRVIYPDAEHDFPPEARQEVYMWLDQMLGRPARP